MLEETACPSQVEFFNYRLVKSGLAVGHDSSILETIL